MALSQSVLSELLDAFRSGEGVDLVRDAVRLVMQELIEVEAPEQAGAARYERTDTRITDRNGSRPRLVATQAGDIELRIPKLRKGSFFPAILEPRRRIDQALYAVVMEAYVHGISTRAVDDLVEAMGVEAGISKSEVSRICAGLDEIVGAFRTRTLGHIEFPYVYLDATYLNVRNATGQVVSMAVIVATGIAADGSREILGLDVGDSEDETFWRGFLTSLKQRGLTGLRLVISDQHAGLVKALKRLLSGQVDLDLGVASVAASLGSDGSEVPALGVSAGRAGFESRPLLSAQARRLGCGPGVMDELSVDEVGQTAFQAAESFFVALAGRSFAAVVGASGGIAGELGDRHHVQGVVELPVAGAGACGARRHRKRPRSERCRCKRRTPP